MADFSSSKKKRKMDFDWTCGNPAIKAALLGWLACIHWRQDSRLPTLPDTPALGRLIASAKNDLWTDQCYQEILTLGTITGITFAKYSQSLHRRVGPVGSSIVLPIILEEEEPKEPSDILRLHPVEGGLVTAHPTPAPIKTAPPSGDNSQNFNPSALHLEFTEQPSSTAAARKMTDLELQRFVWKYFTEKCS